MGHNTQAVGFVYAGLDQSGCELVAFIFELFVCQTYVIKDN